MGEGLRWLLRVGEGLWQRTSAGASSSLLLTRTAVRPAATRTAYHHGLIVSTDRYLGQCWRWCKRAGWPCFPVPLFWRKSQMVWGDVSQFEAMWGGEKWYESIWCSVRQDCVRRSEAMYEPVLSNVRWSYFETVWFNVSHVYEYVQMYLKSSVSFRLK